MSRSEKQLFSGVNIRFFWVCHLAGYITSYSLLLKYCSRMAKWSGGGYSEHFLKNSKIKNFYIKRLFSRFLAYF